jgi:uncharacterized protein YecE (DUF72 family)
MDGLWYRMPTTQAVQSWLEATPPHFVFVPKAHRQITHIHRLKPDADRSVGVMLERLAPLTRSGRLGPVLLQLPPNLTRDDARLGRLLDALPKTARWAVEFRHASWHAPAVESALRGRGVARVAAETDEIAAERRETADFWYARLRRSGYDEATLAGWARFFRDGAERGKDCFVFFKHEDEGAPWESADRLRRLIASAAGSADRRTS